MTALPLHHPRLLTAAEFAALDEATDARYELQEGNIVMSPKPAVRHQDWLGGLYATLRQQAPRRLKVLQDVDIDLGLVPVDRPGTVRAPDLVVVTRTAYDRVDSAGGLLTAADVLLAVEVLSPGSVRTDSVIKRDEYSDAGIPRYWIADITSRPSLTAHHLAGEFGYIAAAPVSGVFTTDEPFRIQLDLDDLY